MDTIDQAIDLSIFIQKAIAQKNWQEVAKLDSDRLNLIAEYYRSVQVIDEGKTRKLLKINDQIVEQLAMLQQQTRSAQIDLRQGNKAARAYLDNAAR